MVIVMLKYISPLSIYYQQFFSFFVQVGVYPNAHSRTNNARPYFNPIIRLTSAESALARATNLRVGVTNIRPQIGQSLALDAYELCGAEPG